MDIQYPIDIDRIQSYTTQRKFIDFFISKQRTLTDISYTVYASDNQMTYASGVLKLFEFNSSIVQ